MRGLPLQPKPPRPRWLATCAVIATAAGGLLLLGWAGVERRPPAELILTGPGQPLAYARTAERLIAGARQRVWLLQYVVRPDDGPIDGLLTALAAARARGVEVRIALDRGRLPTGERDPKNDAAAAWFAAHGLPVVWDEEDCTSHAKILLADDRALLGSHNWTRAAVTANREASLLIADPGQIERLAGMLRGIPGW